MATIIDGSTYKGYFKITEDDTAPNAFYAVPKTSGVILNGVDVETFNLVFAGGAYPSVEISLSTGNGIEDEFGNTLATPAAVLQYLSDNR